jgi:hypothetical protein
MLFGKRPAGITGCCSLKLPKISSSLRMALGFVRKKQGDSNKNQLKSKAKILLKTL